MKKFIIKNTDSYGEKSFEIVRGSVREEAQQTIYEYDSKLGKCQLTISDRRVIISREGEISAIIDVDLDKKTEFVYVTKEMRKLFHIKGESINRDTAKGIIEFSYKIYEGLDELNRITIAIKDY